jgi:hypothetical protein
VSICVHLRIKPSGLTARREQNAYRELSAMARRWAMSMTSSLVMS